MAWNGAKNTYEKSTNSEAETSPRRATTIQKQQNFCSEVCKQWLPWNYVALFIAFGIYLYLNSRKDGFNTPEAIVLGSLLLFGLVTYGVMADQHRKKSIASLVRTIREKEFTRQAGNPFSASSSLNFHTDFRVPVISVDTAAYTENIERKNKKDNKEYDAETNPEVELGIRRSSTPSGQS